MLRCWPTKMPGLPQLAVKQSDHLGNNLRGDQQLSKWVTDSYGKLQINCVSRTVHRERRSVKQCLTQSYLCQFCITSNPGTLVSRPNNSMKCLHATSEGCDEWSNYIQSSPLFAAAISNCIGSGPGIPWQPSQKQIAPSVAMVSNLS